MLVISNRLHQAWVLDSHVTLGDVSDSWDYIDGDCASDGAEERGQLRNLRIEDC